jgi:hypothetical protein
MLFILSALVFASLVGWLLFDLLLINRPKLCVTLALFFLLLAMGRQKKYLLLSVSFSAVVLSVILVFLVEPSSFLFWTFGLLVLVFLFHLIYFSYLTELFDKALEDSENFMKKV